MKFSGITVLPKAPFRLDCEKALLSKVGLFLYVSSLFIHVSLFIFCKLLIYKGFLLGINYFRCIP